MGIWYIDYGGSFVNVVIADYNRIPRVYNLERNDNDFSF